MSFVSNRGSNRERLDLLEKLRAVEEERDRLRRGIEEFRDEAAAALHVVFSPLTVCDRLDTILGES